MADPAALAPKCGCGYDLSGLAGPPWVCPECSAVTRRWPPAMSPLAMTKLERRWRRTSLIAILAAPVGAAWTAPPLAWLFAATAGLGVLAFSATLGWWLVRDERGWARAFAVVPMLICIVGGAVTALLIYGGAAIAAMVMRQW